MYCRSPRYPLDILFQHCAHSNKPEACRVGIQKRTLPSPPPHTYTEINTKKHTHKEAHKNTNARNHQKINKQQQNQNKTYDAKEKAKKK